MSVDLGPKTGMQPPRSPWRWVAAVVAAAVVLVAIVASFGLLSAIVAQPLLSAARPAAVATAQLR